MKEYLFIREEGFYTITLESPIKDKTDDQFAIDNALSNPGTLQVEDFEGNTIWKKNYSKEI